MKCNRIQMADVLGISLPTFDKRVKEGMPYVRKPGEGGEKEWLFDTGEVIQWLVEGADNAEKRDETAEAKLRQLKAEAGLKFLDYCERLEILIPKRVIVERIEAGDAIVKSRIRALPGRLAQKVAAESDAAVCLKLIKDEVEDSLSELNKHWSERG